MTENRYRIPAADIFETKEKFILALDMPGTSKEGIEISCDGEELSILGKVSDFDKDWEPVSTEFRVLDYRRDFTIGGKINKDRIEAKYSNGILTIELEKSESIKPRKIELKAA
ncbi:MAG: Hsp20/alpha crystallin family protein [Brevinematales bacterium]|jgi:HSP20 family protein